MFAFNQKAIQYGVLQREVQAQSDIYNFAAETTERDRGDRAARVGNASLIDPAEVPIMPVKPRKTQDTMFGLLVGFGVGLCIAWALPRSIPPSILPMT